MRIVYNKHRMNLRHFAYLKILYVININNLKTADCIRNIQNRNDAVILIEYNSLQGIEILKQRRHRFNYDSSVMQNLIYNNSNLTVQVFKNNN